MERAQAHTFTHAHPLAHAYTCALTLLTLTLAHSHTYLRTHTRSLTCLTRALPTPCFTRLRGVSVTEILCISAREEERERGGGALINTFTCSYSYSYSYTLTHTDTCTLTLHAHSQCLYVFHAIGWTLPLVSAFVGLALGAYAPAGPYCWIQQYNDPHRPTYCTCCCVLFFCVWLCCVWLSVRVCAVWFCVSVCVCVSACLAIVGLALGAYAPAGPYCWIQQYNDPHRPTYCTCCCSVLCVVCCVLCVVCSYGCGGGVCGSGRVWARERVSACHMWWG